MERKKSFVRLRRPTFTSDTKFMKTMDSRKTYSLLMLEFEEESKNTKHEVAKKYIEEIIDTVIKNKVSP